MGRARQTPSWVARCSAGSEALPGQKVLEGRQVGREGVRAGTRDPSLCSQDLWMFPNVLVWHPEAARALLEYRIRTLAGALDNARRLGYKVRGA